MVDYGPYPELVDFTRSIDVADDRRRGDRGVELLPYEERASLEYGEAVNFGAGTLN